MEILRGPGRKLALPVLFLPLLGWILYVIGFASINNRDTYFNSTQYAPQRAELFWFPHWCVVITGPFVFICSLLHLLIGKWFTGILTSFLTGLYLVCSGAVIHYWAVQLFNNSYGLMNRYSNELAGRSRTDWLVDEYWGLWPLIEWIGALASALFLTFYMMMWPCFKTKKSVKEYESGESHELEEVGEWDEQEKQEEEEEEQEVGEEGEEQQEEEEEGAEQQEEEEEGAEQEGEGEDEGEEGEGQEEQGEMNEEL